MTLIEIKDKRNKLMADAQKLGLNLTTETRTQFDAILADVDVLEKDIERAERVAKFEEETRSAGKPPRGTPGAGPSADPLENAELQKRALRDYMVSGKETRDLGVGPVTGNITGGSQLIAPAFSPILTVAQKAYGGVVNIVNQKTTDTGASQKLAFANDTANGLLVWGEDTAATEVDPPLSTAQSATEMYNTGVILVTLEELQDSYFDIDQFIQQRFGQRLFRGLAKNISQGSSSGVFASYLTGATNGATSLSPTAISYADIVALWNSLDPAYGDTATWTMPSSVRGELVGITDTLGRPIFIPSPSSGAFDTLLGRPIVLDQYLPPISAGSKSLAFGDFREGYTLRSVASGFQIARDPYTYLVSKGAVAFIGYGRGGSYSTDAGTHPIVYLTQHA